jgi:hypothetical protein
VYVQGRRKRVKPDTLATPEEIQKFGPTKNFSGLHSASTPGITALDIHATHNNLILTGGADKHVVLFDSDKETIVKTFKVGVLVYCDVYFDLYCNLALAYGLHPGSLKEDQQCVVASFIGCSIVGVCRRHCACVVHQGGCG